MLLRTFSVARGIGMDNSSSGDGNSSSAGGGGVLAAAGGGRGCTLWRRPSFSEELLGGYTWNGGRDHGRVSRVLTDHDVFLFGNGSLLVV
jgi:hypothetical protein